MSSPKLSVVLCTCNRVDSLRRSVDALLSVKTTHVWELIVVDNGSSDATPEYLRSLDSRRSHQVNIISVLEEKRGLARARNRGWNLSTADIVSFTDDDCYVSESYINSVVAVFEENPEIGFVAGRILLYDETDLRITIKESTERVAFEPRSFIPTGAVHGANMAFRTQNLRRVGGFDERFGAGTRFPCEDIDAMAAILWSDVAGLYDPRPVVLHHHGRKTTEDFRRLVRNYAHGRGAYYAKYLLKEASRKTYLLAWLTSVRREFALNLQKGRFPLMKQSLIELYSGIRYVCLLD